MRVPSLPRLLAGLLVLASLAGIRWSCASRPALRVEAAPTPVGELAPRSSFDFRDGALEGPVDEPVDDPSRDPGAEPPSDLPGLAPPR